MRLLEHKTAQIATEVSEEPATAIIRIIREHDTSSPSHFTTEGRLRFVVKKQPLSGNNGSLLGQKSWPLLIFAKYVNPSTIYIVQTSQQTYKNDINLTSVSPDFVQHNLPQLLML